ncbi:MAG: AAA family ATPase, partial [Phycisphaerales bacterium]|nr:AAA family ATPase [Phycisphaerales bacterium]
MNGPEHKLVATWRSEVERHLVGEPTPVTELMLTLLAGGHALLESPPGLGKTTLVRTVAISAGLDLGRVQCTPDLMPMDITGGDVVLPEQSNAPGAVVFRPGPIFHQVVLADELNRATPRTQSAMLEAMQEGTVTSSGMTRPLPQPFHVLA